MCSRSSVGLWSLFWSLFLPLTRLGSLHMLPTVGIRNALTEFLFLSWPEVVKIDVVQQSVLENLPQDLFFHGLHIR